MPFESVRSSDIFKCQQCGDCCRGYGGTFVTKEEISAIADYLDMDAEDFANNYCQMSGKKPVLAQGRDSYCIFWKKNCTIHPVKPHMCRAWPFIESVLVDVRNWHIMAASCPGIRSDMPDSVVIRCVEKEISNFYP